MKPSGNSLRQLTALLTLLIAVGMQAASLCAGQVGAQTVTATPLAKGTIFVSPDGKGKGHSASDPCSFESLDLYKKKLKIKPGDVVFFRGGVYHFSLDGAKRVYLKGGTADEPVIYESYPGETAIFDGSSISTGDTKSEDWREGRLHLRGEYAILRNVEVRNMPSYGVRIHGNHNIVEGCKIHDNHLSGIGIANITDGYSVKDSGGSHNIVRNNIIYDNSDVGLKHHNYGDGGNADGIIVHSGVGNLISHNTVYGNSDDGIDVWRSMNSVIEFNLVSSHGKGPRGDGNGIKLGGAPPDSPLGMNARARGNISHSNKMSGFNVNSGKNVVIEFNTAFGNGDFGYAIMKDSVLISNISLNNKSGDIGWSKGKSQTDNSWQKEGAIKFLSTDPESSEFLKTDSNSIGAYTSQHEGSKPKELKQ